jgi:hypothetical protein
MTHELKGRLYRGEYNEWLVKTEEQEYQLHPDDVEELLELDRIFDNLEARISQKPEVDFQVIVKSKLTGSTVYAKLIKS